MQRPSGKAEGNSAGLCSVELFNTFLGIYSCLLIPLLGLISKRIELLRYDAVYIYTHRQFEVPFCPPQSSYVYMY